MVVSNVFGYDDPEEIDRHEERVIFFMVSDSCFDQSIQDFESEIDGRILGNTLTIDCSQNGMSVISSSDDDLLLNSMWVIERGCLEGGSDSSLFLRKYLEAWIPSRTEAVVWCDNSDTNTQEFKEEMFQSYNVQAFTDKRELIGAISNHLTHIDPGNSHAAKEELYKWTEDVTEAIKKNGS